jgi:hypothetical protein
MFNTETKMDHIEYEIEVLEYQIDGYINDCRSLMGVEFFGDDYNWESDSQVKGMREKIAELRRMQ